jgi:hypothetical protein
MDFRKTTILPADDKSLSRRMFTEMVNEKPYVLMVVLNKGSEAETFARRADQLAGGMDEHRWVVWVRKPEQIEDLVRDLIGANKLPTPLKNARGFSTSLSDDVRDVIGGEEAVPKLTRVMLAYARAEGKGDV